MNGRLIQNPAYSQTLPCCLCNGAGMVPDSLLALLSTYTHYCVGSLPFSSAPEAVSFILERPWIVPFWPELPQISCSELMLSRAEGANRINWIGYQPRQASGFFELLSQIRQSNSRLEIVKGQLAGPLTLAQAGRSLDLSCLRQAVAQTQRQLMWQFKELQTVAAAVLLVLDEPALSLLGGLGDGVREYLLDAYRELKGFLNSEAGFLGVHFCCEPEPSFTELDFDLYSFDLSETSVADASNMFETGPWSALLQSGKAIIPGIVPAVTRQHTQALERAKELFEKLSSYFRDSGQASPLLIAAGCGHANASRQWLELVYTHGDLNFRF